MKTDTPDTPDTHVYVARLVWDGNRGEGTRSYTGYDREFRALVTGKPDLPCTADPAFRGRPDRHNPEDLFVSAIAACHMLTYLALCARGGVRVEAYEDEARGTMTLRADGSGVFTEIVLRPRVRIADPRQAERAAELHASAHARCFLASSCRFPIRCQPSIEAGVEGSPCRT